MQLIEEQKIEESHMYSFYEMAFLQSSLSVEWTLLVPEDDV